MRLHETVAKEQRKKGQVQLPVPLSLSPFLSQQCQRAVAAEGDVARRFKR
jgi:hypothetical protein